MRPRTASPPYRGASASGKPRVGRVTAGGVPKRRQLLLILFMAIVATFSFMIGFQLFWLPSATSLFSLPAVSAAPVPLVGDGVTSAAQSATMSVFHRASSDARPAELQGVMAPPNITVVMPCFGQVAYLEEGLRSMIAQQYPPAEIIVVDDGSEDRCGEAAEQLLRGNLAEPRRRAVRQLQAWWGWSASDLRRFRDEIVRTPNRGVAHARNTGIRRARGDWICCMDADDTVSPNYFFSAMSHVAKVPPTNLVYANQQFFGESKWQWHVPELKADSALVNGPLPLMTLWRRELWEATPHGFDEVLPKGHEDWAYWLQLMRLALKPHKIEEFLVQYRYKKNSKMRNRERANPEVPRLLRCLFPDLYPVRKLLVDHHELLKPNGFSESVRMDVSVSQHLHPHRAAAHLWRGMILQAKGDLAAAVHAYNASRRFAELYDWQGSFRLWRLLSDMGDAEGAEEVRHELLRLWGPAQLAWYAPDVRGNVLNFRAAAPEAVMSVGDSASSDADGAAP
jgi:glycosyltransferase involved in cell wall biosynthesis